MSVVVLVGLLNVLCPAATFTEGGTIAFSGALERDDLAAPPLRVAVSPTAGGAGSN